MDADRWRVIARNQVKHQVEAVEAELHSIRHRLAEISLRRRRPNAADRASLSNCPGAGNFWCAILPTSGRAGHAPEADRKLLQDLNDSG
jgi:hypothetical protein